METSDIIQLGALLIALVSLIWQQRRVFQEEQLKEKRIEVKLQIFYALSLADRDMTEEEIIQAMDKNSPLKGIDHVEIRKSLYEMLGEETLRFTKENKYKPRQRSPRNEA